MRNIVGSIIEESNSGIWLINTCKYMDKLNKGFIIFIAIRSFCDFYLCTILRLNTSSAVPGLALVSELDGDVADVLGGVAGFLSATPLLVLVDVIRKLKHQDRK